MSESEWARINSLLLLELSLPAIIEKNISKEHGIRIQTASHPRRSTHTHIYTYTPPWMDRLWLILLGDSSPPSDPARLRCPALHTQSQPTGWRDTLQCVYVSPRDEVTRSRWTGDIRNIPWVGRGPRSSFLIKTPPLSVFACLPWCLEYKLSSHHLPRWKRETGMRRALVTRMNMSELAGMGNWGNFESWHTFAFKVLCKYSRVNEISAACDSVARCTASAAVSCTRACVLSVASWACLM